MKWRGKYLRSIAKYLEKDVSTINRGVKLDKGQMIYGCFSPFFLSLFILKNLLENTKLENNYDYL